MNTSTKNESAQNLGRLSVESRKKKFGKKFNKEMQRIAKLPRKPRVEPL